ncbi:DUF6338 family protein [Microbacterium sp. ASV49]|uniref:DUF6338 family protein n=1 Tax=Microbacterium candidum TaxID=3041922 RepID=A0ABT7MW83_9MICO|nr:DUF6338 family protein [Microbacterium sp. ASV49]MDL9978715.1 DUF6338 family protein [Microbacterium sp. ASV49]
MDILTVAVPTDNSGKSDVGIPEGSLAIAAFIVLALPGFIYAGVGRWARGESATDRDVGLTIARGAVFSVALTAVYLLLLGGWLFSGVGPGADADAVAIANPRLLGLTVLVFYVAVPTVVSIVMHRRRIDWVFPNWAEDARGDVKRGFGWVRLPQSKHGYNSVPSAWDHASEQNHQAWVKVKRSNGEWVGGWFTKGSFVTTYPEPRSIYIAHQFRMTNDGNFDGEGPIPGSGVFLMINNDDMVFWTNPARADQEKEDCDG